MDINTIDRATNVAVAIESIIIPTLVVIGAAGTAGRTTTTAVGCMAMVDTVVEGMAAAVRMGSASGTVAGRLGLVLAARVDPVDRIDRWSRGICAG